MQRTGEEAWARGWSLSYLALLPGSTAHRHQSESLPQRQGLGRRREPEARLCRQKGTHLHALKHTGSQLLATPLGTETQADAIHGWGPLAHLACVPFPCPVGLSRTGDTVSLEYCLLDCHQPMVYTTPSSLHSLQNLCHQPSLSTLLPMTLQLSTYLHYHTSLLTTHPRCPQCLYHLPSIHTALS